MATIASMIVNIAADTSELVRNTAQAAQTVQDFADHATETIAVGTMLGNAFSKAGELIVEGLEAAAEAFPDLIEHAIDLGNHLFDMSMKTGASVENLSALRYVASQSGMDFDTLSTAFFKMETSLGATGPKADKLAQSLEGVGLSMADLKNERPDEAFIEIVAALENTGNAADRNALAMQLFSRGAKEMAGLFHEDIYQMIQDAQDLGLVMTTNQAAAAHAAEVGWKAFTMQLEDAAFTAASTLMPALVALEQLASQAFTELVSDYNKAGGIFGNGGTVRDGIVKIGEGFISAVAAAAGFAQGAITGLEDVTSFAIRTGEAIVNVGAALINVMTLGTVDEAGHTILDKTQKALHDTYDALEVLKAPIQTVGDIATKAFSAVETMADGMAGKFGAAYDAAAQKIAEFAEKSKAAGDTIASNIGLDPKTVAAQLAETTKLWDAYYKAVNAASHDHVAAQISDVWLAADAQIAAIEKTKAITVEDYDIIWKTAEQTANNIIQKTLESDKYTREHYQLIADQAKAAYDFALDHAESYTNTEIQLLTDKYRIAQQAADHWTATAVDDMERAAAATTHVATAVNGITTSMQAATQSTKQLVATVESLQQAYIDVADAKNRDIGGTTDVSSSNFNQVIEQFNHQYDSVKASGQYIGTIPQIDPGRAYLLAKEGYSWAEIMSILIGGNTNPGPPAGPRIPGFAMGVTDFAGGLAYVHQGELLVNLPHG
ncbi:MAG TPA: hypothetical protein VEU08_02365, partial [Vicinamibacterales bacterium]|nr:hypothetical protein [Vicinamibacterales bacterium]